MKRWHTNKTKPIYGKNIIIIWKDKDFVPDITTLNEYGYLDDGSECWGGKWNEVKNNIKLWAYVDKYFEKEINNDKDTN